MKINAEPIRIAHIIGKWVGGGVEAVVMNYYNNVDKSKIQFDFICDSDSTNVPYEEIKKLGGRVILVPPYQSVIKYQKQLIKIFKENKYLIVHSHINTLSVFPLRAAKKAGVPIRIAHSHSTIINAKKEFGRNILKNILKNFSKKYANVYFACSETAAISQFGNKTFSEGKVTIINNAIDVDRFKYDINQRKKIRDEFKISDKTLVFGNVGRFVETKNHDFLIKLFYEITKKEKNCKLMLVGQGPREKEIKKLIKKYDLDSKVIFCGQMNQVEKIYQAFDCLIFPSLYEGFGMVAIEAQVTNCLCVCSNNVPDKVKINDNVYFIDLNSSINEWVDICLKTKKNKKKDCSKKIIESNFSITNEVKKLEEIYFKLLGKYGDE